MKKSLILAAAGILCLGTVANAQTVNNGGSLALTGTVEGSILFIFHQDNSGGVTINTGDGTSAAAASLSTVSMFGTADGIVGGTNFTKTKVSGGFTLSGTYKVEVDKANVTSTGFNLGAQMQGSDGITWSVEGSALNNATPVTVVTDGTYALQTLQHLVLAVPDTLAAGAVSNSILYTVTPI